MVKQIKRGGGRMKTAYWSLVSMASAMLISLQPVMADTIWNRFSTIMKDVYGQLVGISTIVAVTAAAIALIVRMISRNQRAVDEATSWLKRIVVTWIVLNSLGFIVAYLQPPYCWWQLHRITKKEKADGGGDDRCLIGFLKES